MIKARHIVELRLAVDNLRAGKGLSTYAWTDPTLTVTSTAVKRVHFLDLRAALSSVCTTAPGARSRTRATTRSRGWMVPTSLLASMTETTVTSGSRSSARASRSTTPSAPTGASR